VKQQLTLSNYIIFPNSYYYRDQHLTNLTSPRADQAVSVYTVDFVNPMLVLA
jgi:hypothetical protein